MAKQNHEISYTISIKEAAEKALNKIKTAFSSFEQQAKKSSGNAENSIKSMANRAQSIANSTSESMKKFGNSLVEASDNAGILNNRFAQMAMKYGPLVVGLGLVAAGVGGIAIAYKSAAQEGIVFQQSMANLKAITNPVAKDFQKIEEHARKMGEQTAFSADQAAGAFTELGKMGFDVEEIIASSESVLNLASATGGSMSSVATSVASTIRQFGLDASEAERVSDNMASSFTKSSLDLDKFSEAMKYAGPVAKDMGISLEETTGMMAVLANNAIHGSMAGTSLRRMMLQLGDEGSKVSKKLHSLGVDVTAPLTDKLRALADANITAAERTEYFGLLSTTAASVLLSNVDSIEQYEEALLSAGGTAERMAETQLDTVEGKLKLMTSALSETKLSLFDTFSDEMKSAIVEATDKIIDLTQRIKNNESAFKEFAKWARAGINILSEFADIALTAAQGIGELSKRMGATISASMRSAEENEALKKETKAINGIIKSYSEHEKQLKDLVKTKEEVAAAFDADIASGAFDRLSESEQEAMLQGLDNLEMMISKEEAILTKRKEMFEQSADAILKIDASKFDEIEKVRKKMENKEGDSSKSKLTKGVGAVDQVSMLDTVGMQTGESEAEKQKKSELARIEQLKKDHSDKLRLLSFSEDERETIAINDKYQKQIELFEKHHADTKELIALRDMEMQAVERAAEEKRMDQKRKEQDELTRLEKEASEERIKQIQREQELKYQAASVGLRGLSNLFAQGAAKNRQYARIAKGLAIADAVANTYVAANKALATYPPPFGGFAAAGVVAQGLVNVANIRAQKFADGGIVGGTSFGGDKVPAMLNSGEAVFNKRQQKNLWRIADGRAGVNNKSNVTFVGGEMNLTVGAGADESMVRRVVTEAMNQQNIAFAEMTRRNATFGVTA